MAAVPDAPPLAEASDVAAVTARFGVQLHDAGVPVDPGRCERFARAVTLVRPRSQQELYACGLATLVSGPEQIEIYDRVFAAAFGISLERAVPVSGAVLVAEPGPRGDARRRPRRGPPPRAGRTSRSTRGPASRAASRTRANSARTCRGGRWPPTPSGWPTGTSPICPRRNCCSSRR